MKLTELHTDKGRVWVNLERIVSVTPLDGDAHQTFIRFDCPVDSWGDYHVLRTNHSVAAVLKMFRDCCPYALPE